MRCLLLSMLLTGCMAPHGLGTLPVAARGQGAVSALADVPLGTPSTVRSLNLSMVVDDAPGRSLGLWMGYAWAPGPEPTPNLPFGLGGTFGLRHDLTPAISVGGQVSGWPIWGNTTAYLGLSPHSVVTLTLGGTATGAVIPEHEPLLRGGGILPSGWHSWGQVGPRADLFVGAPFGLGVSGTVTRAWGLGALPEGRSADETGLAVALIYEPHPRVRR